MNKVVEIKNTHSFGMRHIFAFECYDKHGNLKWRDEQPNLVMNAGLDEMLDKFYKGSNYTASFFVGLTDASPTIAAGDTIASHAGWAEITAYNEATRKALMLGTVSSQSVDNSASVASFAINGAASIGGAFIVTNNTKGGTTGILIAAAALSQNRVMSDSDTLNVTVTATAASS